MFLLLVTEPFCSSTFRAHVLLTCYRNLLLLHFSGTCSSYLLPNPFAPPLFGHMFLLLVPETFCSSTFRAHVPLTCYRNLLLLHFSGTCSSYLFPKSFVTPLFGHMLLLLVTEIFCSSAFRAHVLLTCYRNLLLLHFSGTCSSYLFLHFSGTCSSYLLPKSFAPPLFGHMFLLLVTETFCSSAFRAHVPLTCYRNLLLLRFSGTCSSYLLPKSFVPPLFGYMFLLLVTEIFCSSAFRAHVLLTCYRNLLLLHFSGTCSSYLLPNPFAPPFFGHMFLILVTELICSSTFSAHVPLTCYRNLLFLHFSGTCFPYVTVCSLVSFRMAHTDGLKRCLLLHPNKSQRQYLNKKLSQPGKLILPA